MLTARLLDATDWAQRQTELAGLEIGYFVTDTAAAAAIRASVDRAGEVTAIVSLAGKPELVGPDLAGTKAATLMIVGEDDPTAVAQHEYAMKSLANATACRLTIVPGTADAFIEDGTLESVAQLAADWFRAHLGVPAQPASTRPLDTVQARALEGQLRSSSCRERTIQSSERKPRDSHHQNKSW